eukprot:m.1110456 g.1110456  ORF g.1110456 m.1110456 type:complete len:114 (-) comp24356_c0_seq21:2995-3336(-)
MNSPSTVAFARFPSVAPSACSARWRSSGIIFPSQRSCYTLRPVLAGFFLILNHPTPATQSHIFGARADVSSSDAQDLRPFLYNATWQWQFDSIDREIVQRQALPRTAPMPPKL